MVLVDVGALDLTHRNEVLRQQLAIVVSDSANLVQTLVCVERQMFSVLLQFLGFAAQHELKRFVFVGKQLLCARCNLIRSTVGLPLGDVFRAKQSLFFLEQSPLFFDEVQLDLRVEFLEFSERFVFLAVVLDVASQVHLHQVAHVCHVVASSCHDFGKPRVQLVQSFHLDHSVELAQLFQRLAQLKHGVGHLLCLEVQLHRRVNHVLVQYLVAVGEVLHF